MHSLQLALHPTRQHYNPLLATAKLKDRDPRDKMATLSSPHGTGQSDRQDATSQSNRSPLHDKLVKKLAWTRKLSIAYCEVLQELTGYRTSEIMERDHADLILHWYHASIRKDLKFYEVFLEETSSSSSSSQESDGVEDDQKVPIGSFESADIPERLRLADLTRDRCMSIVYLLWDKVVEILKDGNDVLEIYWMRGHIRPTLVLFDAPHVDFDSATKEIPFLQHDFILLNCGNNESFIVDVSNDQFGRQQWFWKKEDYYKDIVATGFDSPARQSVDDLKHELEHDNEDAVNHQAALLKIFGKLDDVWASNPKTAGNFWDHVDTLPEEVVTEMFEMLSNMLRKELRRKAAII